LLLAAPVAVGADLAAPLAKLRAVGPKGAGNAAAQEAWSQVAAADVLQLTTILAGMKGAGPLAENWLRAAVDAIAQRELAAGRKLPAGALEKFLLDTDNAPRARRIAYEWLAQVDATAPERLMPQLLDDPSLELRYDAVARVLAQAAALEGEAAKARHQQALAAARDLEQVKTSVEALEKLGEKVDVARHLGFITGWKLIGPFDNSGGVGFNATHPPEQELNYDREYEGKDGTIAWRSHATEDPYGLVDLTTALDKHKGAVTYAAAEFIVPKDRQVQLRLGSINANKLWVNGKLVLANEVYHANDAVDQYVGDVTLHAGKNVILLKICQNEQEESWAQKWQFQLRVTDELGGAIHSQHGTK
jgi:hypothetical protein